MYRLQQRSSLLLFLCISFLTGLSHSRAEYMTLQAYELKYGSPTEATAEEYNEQDLHYYHKAWSIDPTYYSWPLFKTEKDLYEKHLADFPCPNGHKRVMFQFHTKPKNVVNITQYLYHLKNSSSADWVLNPGWFPPKTNKSNVPKFYLAGFDGDLLLLDVVTRIDKIQDVSVLADPTVAATFISCSNRLPLESKITSVVFKNIEQNQSTNFAYLSGSYPEVMGYLKVLYTDPQTKASKDLVILITPRYHDYRPDYKK